MANTFRQTALSNVRYNPDLHRDHSISKNDEVVERILSSNEVKAFRENYLLELDNIQKHDYAATTTYTVTIPVVMDDQNVTKSLIAYVNTVSNTITYKLITIEINAKDSTTTYSMSDLDGTNKVTTTLDENFNEVNQEEGAPIQTQGFQDCVYKEFKSLPWFLEAACGGGCTGCFANPFLCAVCAGCLGSSAAHCF